MDRNQLLKEKEKAFELVLYYLTELNMMDTFKDESLAFYPTLDEYNAELMHLRDQCTMAMEQHEQIKNQLAVSNSGNE